MGCFSSDLVVLISPRPCLRIEGARAWRRGEGGVNASTEISGMWMHELMEQ